VNLWRTLTGTSGGVRREMAAMTKTVLAAAPPAEVRGRNTAQRSAVLAVMEESAHFRTAQDIYAELRAQGARVGLTTVYRHLQKLADEGSIHALQTPDRQTAYRLCGSEHHHHLVCTACGAGVEIPATEFEAWAEGEAALRGYSGVTHNVEIFGTCPECSARRGRSG
jgi:Fur family ferric uptake transcriptional regulator